MRFENKFRFSMLAVKRGNLPVLHSLNTQSSMNSKETCFSKPILINAPAPPCMEYVKVGDLQDIRFQGQRAKSLALKRGKARSLS